MEDYYNNDEDSPEVTLPGEAEDYISLEEVQPLVLRHLRRKRDFNGGPYAGQDMVWTVLATEEREGRYDVRLSYRLARGFRG